MPVQHSVYGAYSGNLYLRSEATHGQIPELARSASRLAILPDTTHVTLRQRMRIIVPMVNEALDAKL